MYPDCIKISTAFTQNKGHLIDVKRLEENGKVLHTTLQYINSENKEIIYQRYFIKSIYTAEELISQSDDNRMTLKGYVVVLYIDNELECTHIIKRKMNIQNNFSFSLFVCFVVYKANI